MTLTKHEVGWIRSGPVYGTGRVYQYRVGGLPIHNEAFIANFGSPHRQCWKILQVNNGMSGGWQGEYASADDALAFIAAEPLSTKT